MAHNPDVCLRHKDHCLLCSNNRLVTNANVDFCFDQIDVYPCAVGRVIDLVYFRVDLIDWRRLSHHLVGDL